MTTLNSVLRAIVGLLIVALVVSVAMGVFFRYGLKQSLYWATEVPNVLLIWIVFLASVVAFYEKRHIAFEAVAERLPPAASRVLKIVSELLVLAFLLFLTWYGWQIVIQAMTSLSDALKIPRGYFYLCVPISAALMSLISVENLYRLIVRPNGSERP